MKVLVGGLYHETHCFVPDLTPLDHFRVDRGEELLARRGDGSTIDGFLEVAEESGWDVVPACAYSAMPSGKVADEVVAAFWADLEATFTGSAARGVQAVYLSLHGAMVSESLDDVEGAILARLRALPGMNAVPIFGVFDLHANFSRRMAECANGLICYRENPHTDARETAVRAARMLARSLETGILPHMTHRNAPVVWPPTGTGTTDRPMGDLEALAREMESLWPELWAVNVVGGYSFADVEDAGVCFSVVSTASRERDAQALANLVRVACDLKACGLPHQRDLNDVLAETHGAERGPIVLVEASDNIGAGAPGDGTGALRGLVEHDIESAIVIINDPENVARIAGLPDGAQIVLSIGGKGSELDSGPLPLAVNIVSRSDGRFELQDANSHLAAMQGRYIDMGPSVVVRHKGITILLTSRKTPPFDLGQLYSQGIDPSKAAYVVVKAAVAHRRAYDPIAAASFTIRTPGPCTSDPAELPYHRIRRPVFPLDSLICEHP